MLSICFLSERILEDLETLDPREISDYNEKDDLERDSFGTADTTRLSHNYSKYFLVLRQSTVKYDMFRSQQVKLIPLITRIISKRYNIMMHLNFIHHLHSL